MAITPEHVPHIPHLPIPDIRGGLRWVKDNSLTLSLALAIAAGSTYFIASHDQKPPIKPTTGVSDTIKPPESEFVVVPAIPTPTENLPAAAQEATPPKPTETATPAPKTGYDSENGVYREKSGVVLNVPRIEGLRAEENEQKKVVYLAEKGNKYGLEANAYAGEFVPNVTMQENGVDKQTGGVALEPPVVLKLIQDKLATIPNQADKWVATLPVDPRSLKQNEGITLTLEPGKNTDLFLLAARFKGKLPLVNIIVGSDQLRIGKGYYGVNYFDQMRLVETYTNSIFLGREMRYFTVSAGTTDLTPGTTINSKFGSILGQTERYAIVSIGAATEARSMSYGKVLSVSGLPVFVASN